MEKATVQEHQKSGLQLQYARATAVPALSAYLCNRQGYRSTDNVMHSSTNSIQVMLRVQSVPLDTQVTQAFSTPRYS